MFQHGWKSFFLHDIIIEFNFSIHVTMSKKFNYKKKKCNAMLVKGCKILKKNSTYEFKNFT